MSTPITLQHIFNLAWQAFIVEGKPPAVTGNDCEYETEDGRRCAIGLALPDVLTHPHTGEPVPRRGVTGSFGTIVRRYPQYFDQSIRAAIPTTLIDFQGRLHDSLQLDGHWTQSLAQRKKAYRNIAKDYGLTVPGDPS